MHDQDIAEGMNSNIKYINMGCNITKIPLWRINALYNLRNIIKKEKTDIICAFVSDVAVMSRIASLGINAKFISAERGDPYSQTRLWRILTSWAYKKSDYCFFQLDKARDFYGKKVREKSFVIPNPYIQQGDVEPYDGIRKKTIVSVGRFEPEKGYDVLIDAFYNVHRAYPEYALILYGKGSLASEYLEQVNKLGLEGCVSMPGYINDVTATIREDGVFVLPSRYEGIPNALLEAMSVGVPTVSTDCTPGGPAFLTNNGERGLLVPIDDKSALENAIIRIITNQRLAKEISHKGREITELLNPTKIEEKWIAAFEKIIRMWQEKGH